MTTLHRVQNGFTLAELAVVLVIIGLLLGGLMAPLTTQTDIRSRADTVKTLADIREALIGFAIINGRLPCPADRLVATTATDAGLEATTGTGSALTCACSTATSDIAAVGSIPCDDSAHGSATGVVPWATLGLPEADSWGSRFTYRVTLQFARSTGQSSFWDHSATPPASCTPSVSPTMNSAFALCSDGDTSALTAFSGGTTLAGFLPAIVVSHGKNNAGAWLPNGSQIPGAAGDELENADGDTTFVSNANIDDQLIWVSPNLLMNRMIAAGRLP